MERFNNTNQSLCMICITFRQNMVCMDVEYILQIFSQSVSHSVHAMKSTTFKASFFFCHIKVICPICLLYYRELEYKMFLLFDVLYAAFLRQFIFFCMKIISCFKDRENITSWPKAYLISFLYFPSTAIQLNVFFLFRRHFQDNKNFCLTNNVFF